MEKLIKRRQTLEWWIGIIATLGFTITFVTEYVNSASEWALIAAIVSFVLLLFILSRGNQETEDWSGYDDDLL